ncbi:ethanolamine ammonia-lyase reactivating factor EutA [Pectinatus haikarae]|uniref:Ethanolamine utilization protein EutA n=1 Tax=Pectinatus haikarae TaxID=349096 RepID=A0ABT9Y6N5_9FIRM|nr:ethanolamine ammonia-lyase reactivating factor EutA [Pectinatus haikarae]MDQ0203381.1 ethanolamine utilization protein EutA [Pectinatus haikarae]
MQESLLSVGIDLGTTTTQIIFSRIYLEDKAVTAVPEVKISRKEIIYKSTVYFTPVLSDNRIDLPALKNLVEKEYLKAGIKKNDLQTGAVIITGETARKENASAVLQSLSDFAGDFVVATAGPDLESLLAGLGAGAGEKSKNHGEAVLNFDIGGGTTNAALFIDGEASSTFALDIGGRLLRLQKDGTINYVSAKIKDLLVELGLEDKIRPGEKADFGDLHLLTRTFAKILYRIIRQLTLTPAAKKLFIGHECGPFGLPLAMISGGVAEYVYRDFTPRNIEDVALFGDIGPLLGSSVRDYFSAHGMQLQKPKEKIRATVIGAGTHSLCLSGSTISADESVLPIKNLPVMQLSLEQSTADIEKSGKILQQKLRLFPDDLPALALAGTVAPSYSDVKTLARMIAENIPVQLNQPLVILLEADFAKALGLTLKRYLADTQIICLDRIKAHDGDYIDIGRSIGSAVPVVVKTLIFTA